MFKDRDIAILGAGALLAILTALLLPFSLPWKVLFSFLILVFFMFLALLRLGPDRVTPEEWLKRRISFRLRAHRYVYQQQQPVTTNAPPARQAAQQAPAPAEPPRPTPQPRKPRKSISPSLSLAFDEVGIYPLVTVFLAVVGVWFAIWVAQGGGVELSRIFNHR